MTAPRREMQIPQDVMECVLDITSSAPGEATYAAAVRALSRLLEVKCAFVAVVEGTPPTRARTVALMLDGEVHRPIEYELAGTPCDQAHQESMCFIPQGVAERFPGDPWLAEVGAQSYVGIPFRCARGRPLGHLGIVHSAPLEEGLHQRSVFRLIAALVGSELVSRDAQRQKLEVERKLLEGHRLESLGLLAGGVAHDFNNLLVGITGNISLALLDTPAHSPTRPYLEEIEVSATRASDLAKQMMAYSGRGRLTVAEVDLNEVVEEMTSLLTVSIPRAHEVRCELRPGLPAVRADLTQLRQLVMNLVLNASEAIGDQNGTIFLGTELCTLREPELAAATIGTDRSPGDYVALKVSDSGCGLSPEVQSRMFEPFFTQKPRGRGLGLAAVQGIVHGHEGALMVDSELGQGTTFRLYLPARESPATARAPNARRRPVQLEARVLIIDDDDTVRGTTARMVEQLGGTVTTANSGEQALELLPARCREFDLVLLDMDMPRMNGEQTFRELRRIDETIRVVLMSGYDEADATHRFPKGSLAGFLQKPFGIHDLITEVERARR